MAKKGYVTSSDNDSLPDCQQESSKTMDDLKKGKEKTMKNMLGHVAGIQQSQLEHLACMANPRPLQLGGIRSLRGVVWWHLSKRPLEMSFAKPKE